MTLVCSLRLGLGSRISLGASNMRHVWLRSLGIQWDCSWLLMLPFQKLNFGRRSQLSHPAWLEVVQVMISSTLTTDQISKRQKLWKRILPRFFPTTSQLRFRCCSWTTARCRRSTHSGWPDSWRSCSACGCAKIEDCPRQPETKRR